MKAIIPVAGAGKRLRPLTYTQPKPLIPVAGKPIISYIMDELIEIGLTEFVFVIGYHGDKVRNFIEKEYPDIDKTFIEQNSKEGPGHAVWMAKEAVQGEQEALIVFGDAIYNTDFKLIAEYSTSCLGIQKVKDPREYGVVELDDMGNIIRMVEKPKIPRSNMALVGIYKVKELPKLMEALDYNIKNDIRTMGQFHLTDGLVRMINQGVKFTAFEVNNWYNCGRKEILLETNAALLDKKDYASYDLPPYDNAIIIHPVSIGKKCEIRNSIIGPHVTIGSHSVIDTSIISESIIGNYVAIKEIVLRKSVVGNDASITGMRQSLNIGDNTEIDLS